MKPLLLSFFLCAISPAVQAQQTAKGFEIVERPDNKQVDILYNGHLMTAYCYYDSIMKPFLYPVNTVDGITVTRGYPIKPLPGESIDHPHHTGVWMNYEWVNGLDFWNNSTAIPMEKKALYGTIRHQKVVTKKAAKDSAILTAIADWVQPDGKVLLKEATTYIFKVRSHDFVIDRITHLTATDQTVTFKDTKDGFFAIRVAKELEMPAAGESTFTDVHGNKTTVAKSAGAATGMYYGSTGLTGDSVWSSQGKWVMLKGQKDGQPITIAIMDHPANVGYPAYWHARGYGLFAVNPLGRKVFSNGKEELNFSLTPGAATTFRYRLLVRSGQPMTAAEMNGLDRQFEQTQ